jgi:dihydrofolate synthase / folylpolyglutamate synthase
MTYNEALDFLFTQLPMYQRNGASAYKNNLDNTKNLDKHFNHPHKSFRTIHVAGTNGKGSVSHLLASILQTAGFKTGLYTSPHLKDFRERIKIDGIMIPEDDVLDFVELNKTIIEQIQPSFFEMSVAMAFNHFAKNNVDIAVIEVGLGGRLDSTNIITPEISVITNIGMDHVAILGNTIELIAREKAGIIKQNIPVIIGRSQNETASIFTMLASKNNSSILFADQFYRAIQTSQDNSHNILSVYKENSLLLKDIELPLLGDYQTENLQTVIAAIEQLITLNFKISQKDIYKGIKRVIDNTSLLGRWQKIGCKPDIICDTGHNEDGIKIIVSQLKRIQYNKLHVVIGMVNDKSPDSILSLLPEEANYYFTKADSPRSLDPTILQNEGKKHGLFGEICPTVADAIKKAKKNASDNDLIFIGGSTFVVAEAI